PDCRVSPTRTQKRGARARGTPLPRSGAMEGALARGLLLPGVNFGRRLTNRPVAASGTRALIRAARPLRNPDQLRVRAPSSPGLVVTFLTSASGDLSIEFQQWI